MGTEFLCVFPAERERVGWIDAAGDHAHERFIVVRLRSLDLFNLEHIRWAVFVRNDGSHFWFLLSARCTDKNDSDSGKTQQTKSRSNELQDVTFARDRSLCELKSCVAPICGHR